MSLSSIEDKLIWAVVKWPVTMLTQLSDPDSQMSGWDKIKAVAYPLLPAVAVATYGEPGDYKLLKAYLAGVAGESLLLFGPMFLGI